MKKFLSILISFCLMTGVFSLYSYAAPLTDEITLDEFAGKLSALEKEYDGKYVGEIFLEDGSDTYKVGNEEFEIENETVSVDNGEIDIPVSILTEYSVDSAESEMLETKTRYFSNTQTVKDYAESLGYDVIDHGEKATLKQTYQTHRLIVKSKKSIDYLDAVDVIEGYNDLHIVQFDNLESTVKALEYYNNCKNVEFAEPDTVMHTAGYGWHQSWGSDYIGVDAYIDTMPSTANDITVAVIDTGIELTHDFLQGRIIPTGFNTSGSGASDSENDDHGHGTHVAGIVVDNTTDNVMVAGYKCLDNTGYGTLTQVCACVDKAVQDGVNVINMSLTEEGYSTIMEQSVHNAVEHRIPVVVAAGNDSDNAINYSPSNISECITVAALEAKDGGFRLASFSNYGTVVDVIAPGVNIASSFIGNRYETLNGTSMATPFAAAAAAMFLSVNNSLSNNDIVRQIKQKARTDWTKPTNLPNAVALSLGEVIPDGTAIKPRFNLPGGDYDHSVLVELSCATQDTSIYYTADGSDATVEDGTLYTGPILIRKPTVLSAVAVAPGFEPSEANTLTYNVTVQSHIGTSDFSIDNEGFITEYKGSASDVTVPTSIIGVTVTGIAQDAFKNKTNVTSIKFPASLTYIDDGAFYGCTSLEYIDAYALSYIGKNAFCGCTSLLGIDGLDTRSISENAFYGCTALKNVSGGNIVFVGKNAFDGCNNLESIQSTELKHIGSRAFNNCSELSAVNMGNLRYIGEYSFANCSSIEGFSNSYLERIPEGAFLNCTGLNSVDLPNVVRVENFAFQGNTALNQVNLPKVEFLGGSAFEDCTGIESIDFAHLIQMDESGYQFCGCSLLKTVRLPELGGWLPSCAFASCGNLEELILNSITDLLVSSVDSQSLKLLYIPQVKMLASTSFLCEDLPVTDALTVFSPKLEKIFSVPDRDSFVFYLTDKLNEYNLSKSHNYTFCAPADSIVREWAEENGKTFVDCYSIPITKSEYVRPCFYGGMRFNSIWQSGYLFRDYSEKINFSFEYEVAGTAYETEAGNYSDDGSNIRLNFVINSITANDINERVSVVPVVTVDGMVFKKLATQSVYSELAVTAFDNYDVNRDLIIDDEDLDILTELSVGCLNPDSIPREYLKAADINRDGYVDAFDLAVFDRYIIPNFGYVEEDNIVHFPV